MKTFRAPLLMVDVNETCLTNDEKKKPPEN